MTTEQYNVGKQNLERINSLDRIKTATIKELRETINNIQNNNYDISIDSLITLEAQFTELQKIYTDIKISFDSRAVKTI